jgi:acetoin utilization protein AcuB
MGHMVAKRIRELPVMEDGALAGILTERDIKMALGPDARRMDLDAIDPRQLDGAVDWFMTPGVETISEAASLGEATTKLLELRVGALPVVDEDGGLVGILSVTDVLAEAARRFA